MREDDKQQDYQQDPDGDEVEILEVVGVDEDLASSLTPADSTSRSEEPREFFLSIDDEDPDERSSLSGPSAQQAAPPTEASPDQEVLLRLRADYDNLRKRIDRERKDFELRANSSLVSRLLPVLDNFERALTTDPGAGPVQAFKDGVEMIYRHLVQELRREGLREIEAEGHAFDPNLHDAVATQTRCGLPVNTVVEQLQRGYLFQDRVLRPALVKVSVNGPEGPDDSEENGDGA